MCAGIFISVHIDGVLIVTMFLPALSYCWRWSRMSPEDSGGDQTRSPVVVLQWQSDPVSSASWERRRCPESPRCADSSPDHLRGRNRKTWEISVRETPQHRPLKVFIQKLSKSNILSSGTKISSNSIHPNIRHIIQLGLCVSLLTTWPQFLMKNEFLSCLLGLCDTKTSSQ